MLGCKSKRRLTAFELYDCFENYFCNIDNQDQDLYKQIEECDKLNSTNPANISYINNSTSYEIHPSAIYVSRCLDYKGLPTPKIYDDEFYQGKLGFHTHLFGF